MNEEQDMTLDIIVRIKDINLSYETEIKFEMMYILK